MIMATLTECIDFLMMFHVYKTCKLTGKKHYFPLNCTIPSYLACNALILIVFVGMLLVCEDPVSDLLIPVFTPGSFGSGSTTFSLVSIVTTEDIRGLFLGCASTHRRAT